MISEYARIQVLTLPASAMEISNSGANLVSDRKVGFYRNLGCALAGFYGHCSSRDLHIYIHPCMHTYTHMHTYSHAYIHTCVHTYMHTLTLMLTVRVP